MAAPLKDTVDLALRPTKKVEEFFSDLAEKKLFPSKNMAAVAFLEAGIDWVLDPDPLAPPPKELQKIRRALRGDSIEVVGSLLREDPPYGATVSDNMLRLLEKTVEAQAETIAIQRAEIARLRCYER